MRFATLAMSMMALIGISSCSTQARHVLRPLPADVSNFLYPPSGERPDPGIVYPDYQVEAEWSAPDLITYRDNGIVCVSGGGAYSLDHSLIGIWTVSPSNGIATHMTQDGYDPAWSPDRKKLAFDLGGRIYVFEPNSGRYTQFANTSDVANFSPAWSPSGQEIAFDSYAGHGDLEVWIMSADGSNSRRVIPHARFGSWDPSGKRMICEGVLDGTAGVLEYDIAMGVTTLLRAHDDFVQRPRYSADGSRIVYFDRGIWVMDADGSNAHQITDVMGYGPAWSPDGTKLVYMKAYGETFTADAGVLWAIDLGTLQQHQVTRHWPMRCQHPESR